MDVEITVRLPGGIEIKKTFATIEEAQEWARKARLEAMLKGDKK